MEFNHKPVLLDECIESLNIRPDGTYVDGTLGGAGHALEVFKRLNEKGCLIGLDQDAFALETSRKRLEAAGSKAALILENTNFRNMSTVCEQHRINGVDGILLDLGVSSHQLDEAERGFSYQHDAPLDMRMDRSRDLNAEIIVNSYSELEIRDIIRNYGEEKWASRIAAFIVRARSEKRIVSTHELVDIIKAAIPAAARREGPHPAKRTFQALRIAVNDELGALKAVIGKAVSLLKSGGRLAIISFHSLEDRIVKEEYQRFAKPCTCPDNFPVCVCGKEPQVKIVTKKPLAPSELEQEVNPRARSAKLRVLEKL